MKPREPEIIYLSEADTDGEHSCVETENWCVPFIEKSAYDALLSQAEAMADSLQAIDKKQTYYSEPYSSHEIVEEALKAWQKFKEDIK